MHQSQFHQGMPVEWLKENPWWCQQPWGQEMVCFLLSDDAPQTNLVSDVTTRVTQIGALFGTLFIVSTAVTVNKDSKKYKSCWMSVTFVDYLKRNHSDYDVEIVFFCFVFSFHQNFTVTWCFSLSDLTGRLCATVCLSVSLLFTDHTERQVTRQHRKTVDRWTHGQQTVRLSLRPTNPSISLHWSGLYYHNHTVEWHCFREAVVPVLRTLITANTKKQTITFSLNIFFVSNMFATRVCYNSQNSPYHSVNLLWPEWWHILI